MSALKPRDATSAHIAAELDPDHRIVLAVYPGDQVIWWLVNRDIPEDARHGCCCARCAPHEGRGRMSHEWLRRAGCQCVVTKKKGGRCQNVTEQPGQTCRVHEGWKP